MGKTCARIALAAILIAAGYQIGKHNEAAKEVASGLYDKTTATVKQPFRKLYDWTTEGRKPEAVQPGELENKLQDNYQP